MGAMSVPRAAVSRFDLRRWIVRLRRTRHGGIGLDVGAVVLLAVAYYLAGRIGLELGYLDGAVAALWPPAGVGVAVVFLRGGPVLGGVGFWGFFPGGLSFTFCRRLGQYGG